jgi:hypothetical protein
MLCEWGVDALWPVFNGYLLVFGALIVNFDKLGPSISP